MISRLNLTLTIALTSSALAAQQPKTVDDCVTYAIENSVVIKNAEIDRQIADTRVKETIGIGLPQINGGVTLNHNQKQQRFFITKSSEGFFDFSDVSVPDGSILAVQSFFSLKSSGDANLSINQLIFNGSYLVGLKAANAYRDLTVKQNNQTREELVENVRKAFYGALINKERIHLFDSNIGRVDSLLTTTRAMYEQGFAEKIDVDRIQVTYNNLVAEREKFVNLQELSIDLLKFQMNYPMDEALDVAGDLKEATFPGELEAYYDEWEYADRPEYQLLEANKRLQELNIKNHYAQALPVLSAYAGLGYSTQSPNIGGLFKTETDLEDNGAIGPDTWYPYSNFGLRLSIPIFSGLQRSYGIQEQKLTLLKINNSFESLRDAIDIDIKRAVTTYKNSLKSLDTQEENMGLAENVAHVTKIKYEQGVGSNLEVVQAESDYKTAQVNYYNSLYDAMIAKVDLEKAFGVLRDESQPQN